MAGHNKWTQIKRKKGAEDIKRGQLFSVLSRAIAAETKRAAGDQNDPGLQRAIVQARAANMPGENIERAIKGAVRGEADGLERPIYEVYGPGGAAIIISCLTDNKNRTVQELKHLLGKHQLTLAAPGSVRWVFEKTVAGWRPKNKINIGEEIRSAVTQLLEDLNNHPDVNAVFTNL